MLRGVSSASHDLYMIVVDILQQVLVARHWRVAKYAEVYCNRGITHKEIGEYGKARADFQRAFELATEQDNQVLAQAARRSLGELPPAGGED